MTWDDGNTGQACLGVPSQVAVNFEVGSNAQGLPVRPTGLN